MQSFFMNDFIFDQFFMNSSIYTVEFVAPSEHVELLCELIMRTCPKCISVLLQQDSLDGFTLSFVSVYSIFGFHKLLFSIVDSLRYKFHLSSKQFYYL